MGSPLTYMSPLLPVAKPRKAGSWVQGRLAVSRMNIHFPDVPLCSSKGISGLARCAHIQAWFATSMTLSGRGPQGDAQEELLSFRFSGCSFLFPSLVVGMFARPFATCLRMRATRECPQSAATCGRLPVGKGFLDVLRSRLVRPPKQNSLSCFGLRPLSNHLRQKMRQARNVALGHLQIEQRHNC